MPRTLTLSPLLIALRVTAVIFAAGATALLSAAVAAWLVGRIVSDRFGWSQWLLWIPSPVAIVCAAVGVLIIALWRGRGWSLYGSFAALALMMIYFACVEHRMLRTAEAGTTEGLRIVHWNASPSTRRTDAYFHAMVAAGGEITVLTDAGAMPFRPEVWRWNEGPPISARPFAIVSRIPVIRQRYLVNEDDIVVLLLEFDTIERLGRTLVLYAVDMPSDLDLSRAELARRARRMIDNADAPRPDIVVGDFNMTRGGYSVRTMFPGMDHAYDQAGRGYAATFRRDWPLYHIDHILLGEQVRATRYDILDPGIGRHRIQRVTIIPQN